MNKFKKLPKEIQEATYEANTRELVMGKRGILGETIRCAINPKRAESIYGNKRRGQSITDDCINFCMTKRLDRFLDKWGIDIHPSYIRSCIKRKQKIKT